MDIRATKKKAISLLEILIVIFLIGIISSVVAFNLRGSLDKGRAFKTKQMIHQLEEVFTLELMQDPGLTPEMILEKPEKIIARSPLIKDGKNALLDGWNKPLKLEVTRDGEIKISSTNLKDYETKEKKIREKKNK